MRRTSFGALGLTVTGHAAPCLSTETNRFARSAFVANAAELACSLSKPI